MGPGAVSLAFEIALGVAIGLFSTVITLLVFHYVFSAGMRFSRDVRVYWSSISNKPIYSIRIKKTGIIDLIETRIHCNIYINDISKKGTGLQSSFRIRTTFSDSIRIRRGFRIVHIQFLENEKINKMKSAHIKNHVSCLYPDVGVRPEDIFRAYNEVYARVFVLGHDRFTGVKKLYVSPRYFLHNFVEGEWDEINIIRKNTPPNGQVT